MTSLSRSVDGCALAVVITLIDVPLLRFLKLMGAVLSSIGA